MQPQLVYQNLPFFGETVADGYAEKGESASQVKNLSFGPVQTKKSMVMINIKRGPDDKTDYKPQTSYDVPVLISSFRDTIYYRTTGNSTPVKAK